MCTAAPVRSFSSAASVWAGPSSPWTRKIVRGTGDSRLTQLTSSAWSACALKPSSEVISARTRTGSPNTFTVSAPSLSRRPSVPSPWKPTNSTVLRSFPSACCRWWRMRPPSHMPEAEMMMQGERSSLSARDSSTLVT